MYWFFFFFICIDISLYIIQSALEIVYFRHYCIFRSLTLFLRFSYPRSLRFSVTRIVFVIKSCEDVNQHGKMGLANARVLIIKTHCNNGEHGLVTWLRVTFFVGLRKAKGVWEQTPRCDVQWGNPTSDGQTGRWNVRAQMSWTGVVTRVERGRARLCVSCIILKTSWTTALCALLLPIKIKMFQHFWNVLSLSDTLDNNE